MPATQRFRSAFHGFNREDVVNYIEYLNNHYTAQVQQLNNQLQEAKGPVSEEFSAIAARTEQQLMESQASLATTVDRFKAAAATLQTVKDE